MLWLLQVYWNPKVEVDGRGEFTASFDLSDSVTTYRIMVDTVSAAGVFGQADLLIEAQLPTYAEVKVPVELTVGDQPNVPVTVVVPALGKQPESGKPPQLANVKLEYRASGGLTLTDPSLTVR